MDAIYMDSVQIDFVSECFSCRYQIMQCWLSVDLQENKLWLPSYGLVLLASLEVF